MLTPLWTARHTRLPHRAVSARPHVFAVRDRVFVYDPDDMRLFLSDGDGVDEALAQAQTTASEKPQFALPQVEPRMIVLVLTSACNLRCRYCFVDDARPPQTMDLLTARQAMCLVPTERDFTLGFFGGEPLLAFDRLREIVDEARAVAAHRGVSVRFSLTTNGTLLDANKARWLAEQGFSLIVSLDGPAPLHDAARPDALGRESHARVLAGLLCVAEHPLLAARTTLRGTYDGSDEAHGSTHAHLVDRLIYLNRVARELGLGNVSVEPADLSEGCGRGGVRPVQPGPALAEEYFDAARWFVEETRAGRKPRFHHLSVRMQRLLKRTPAPSECGAGVGYLAVAPDGTLHACHRLGESVVGHAREGVDLELQAPWRDNRYYQRRDCATCWLRNVCGGGCRLNSVHRCRDIRRPDPLGCWLTETCVQAAAWAMAELAGDRCAS